MLLHKKQIIACLENLVSYDKLNTDIYFIGSTAASRQFDFNSTLSDIDLLIISDCNSIEKYVQNLTQAIKINHTLNEKVDNLVETFMMSSRIARDYFMILPIIANGSKIEIEDLAYGSGDKNKKRHDNVPLPTMEVLKAIYTAKSLQFCHEYSQILPVADTSRARQTVKRLLKGLKMVICAEVNAKDFDTIERRLCSTQDFKVIEKMFLDIVGEDIVIDDIMQDVLNGKGNVDDWSRWMTAQEMIATTLVSVTFEGVFTPREHRLYGGIVQVRDLLNKRLKDILSVTQEESRSSLIEVYTNDTASVIAKLALADVPKLGDFDDAPKVIKDAYIIVVEHLQGKICDLSCLAASMALLEYAYEQSVATANIHEAMKKNMV